MIGDLFLIVIATFVRLMLGVVNLIWPYNSGLPVAAMAAAPVLAEYVWIYNGVFPVDTLFTVIFYAFEIFFAVQSVKLIFWIIGLVRGSGYHSGTVK